MIGPNGAGKSTLVNLLSGELAPSAGTIRLRGDEHHALAVADRIARGGVARSVPAQQCLRCASPHSRIAVSPPSRAGRDSFDGCKRPSVTRELNDAALAALTAAGLAERGASLAAELSHGEQRQLEIAMSLATAPDVLLLDEPLAGMGSEESQRMVALLKRLAPEHAILLVEHDMDAVFALADQLTVMVNGAVLASGSPEVIRANAGVQRAYLGFDPTSAGMTATT